VSDDVGREYHEATAQDVARLGKTLLGGRVFSRLDEIDEALARHPWALQVSGRGEVVALSRWREHLSLLALDALWCAERRIAPTVIEMVGLAEDLGFSGVVSPPVPLAQAFAYERAGMRVHETLIAYRLSSLGRSMTEGPDGRPDLRTPTSSDIDALLTLDAACFDDFWRYDRAHLGPFVERGECRVLEVSGEAIGYTLCTHEHHESLLGRVGVHPAWRRRGIGARLICDAAARAAAAGAASMMLVTQAGNAASRALYERLGFRDTGSRYAFLRSD
jgi:ribosomal protein S18 acetylase RimI-like enzyme